MTDVHIRDAQVVTARGVQHGEIAITDGTIDAAGPASSVPTPSNPDIVIDADEMVAIPGAVDVHTHMHDDELFPDGIDFASQTASAVAGGVTTVIELPTQTPVTTPAALQEKAATCADLAHVDFGLVAGNVQEPDIDVTGIMSAGTADFKTFTADPYLADDETIARLMRQVGDAGGTVRVHCETQGLLDDARSTIDGDEPDVYMDSRPLEAELDAISRACCFAEYADCPLHVVHISSGSGAREAARFNSRANVPVTLETCPQYLAFSKGDVAEKGPFLKVNPSLKSDAERERLWDAVRDGTIDLIGTDHFPTYRETREAGWEDIWEPDAGLPGVETMVEFLVSEGVHEGRISWPRLRELVCAAPARNAGIYPKKGSLQVGTDADVMLVRTEEYEVTADDHAFVGGWTPYEGQYWSARVDTVIAGGEVVATDHRVQSTAGRGQFLDRPL
ncbi:dihydroorotase [Haloarcula sp. CBA1130]|uniref:dihydroorotase n=1 Tax=unclassified Haloarcula TaxID=2624677 RepID=UPI0012462A82|nr:MULTISPECIES: amidohydrolase family protein [unclassified Haloarcula]KAA9395980.1 dihydroorotase [Haloarcula sp. CBA1129]KAA9400490.1 dihydroorotase [Haloarcula sp. CBA1130]